MKSLIVLALCVAATVAVPLGQSKPITILDLYKTASNENRIIGGSPASRGQIPFQAAVYFTTGGGTFFCGGSLISNQWVLSAAHCCQGASSFTINLGGITLNANEDGRITVYTSTAVVHPNYSSSTLNNDICLIRLNDAVSFTDTIQPVTLPNRGEVVGANEAVTVSGWGRTTDDNNNISNVLNYVTLTTISNQQCAQVYGSTTIISSTICAVGNPYHSTCNGDSGGPLVRYSNNVPVHIGVVSFVSSAGCGSGNPSGYVRTESFLDWIASTTGLDV